MSRLRRLVSADRGSAPVEFVMVGALLTLVTLSVQLGLALHVRNTLSDAASEGARYAGLAGNTLADGVARTKDLISVALGPRYASAVTASYDLYLGQRATVVTVHAPLPVMGLLGPSSGLEVAGHAALETLD